MSNLTRARRLGMTVIEMRMCYDMEAEAEHIKNRIQPKRMTDKQRQFVALKAQQTIDRMNEIIAKVS
jgi:hypothetical protein